MSLVSQPPFEPVVKYVTPLDLLLVLTTLSATNTRPGGASNWEYVYIRYLSPPVPGEAAMNNYTPLWPYTYSGGARSTLFDEFEANDRTYYESATSFMPMLYNVIRDFAEDIVDNKIIIEISYDGAPDHYDWGYISHAPQTVGVSLYKDTVIEDYEYYTILNPEEGEEIDWDAYEALFEGRHVSEVHHLMQFNLAPTKRVFYHIFNVPPRTIGPVRHIIGYLTIDLTTNIIEFSTEEPTIEPPSSE